LQGQLGNCWLVAAMTCLAEFPASVKALFRARDENAGKYTLHLFDHKQDRFVDIVVDEFVPCHPRRWWDVEGKPLFARPNGNEMWCLLLEKAMAKLFGSYAELVGGHPATAFRAFTGERNTIAWQRGRGGKWSKMTLVPRKTAFEWNPVMQEKQRVEKFFGTLQQYDIQNFMIGASIKCSRDVAEYRRPDGLVEGHSYAVLHVMQVESFQLMCLRNPWGSDQEWTGRWADDDSMWVQNPAVEKRLRPDKNDNGTFWMCWEDFSEIFDMVYICCRKMRSGVEADKHAEAAKFGSIVGFKEVMASIRLPPAPSHPERPAPRRLEAVAEEPAGAGPGKEDADFSPRRPRPFAPGQNVEYYSDTHSIWIATKVVRYNEAAKTYDLECKAAAAADRVRAVGAFAVGEQVEYFSRSHGCWIQTKVRKYNLDRNTYDLECKAGAVEECIRKPGQKRRRRRAPGGRQPTFIVGEAVQYYSESQRRWIQAKVVKVYPKQPMLDLDCKAAVHIERVKKMVAPVAEPPRAAPPGVPGSPPSPPSPWMPASPPWAAGDNPFDYCREIQAFDASIRVLQPAEPPAPDSP